MRIDFVRPAPPPVMGWVLLLAGLGLLGVAAHQVQSFRAEALALSLAQEKVAEQLAATERQRAAALPRSEPSYENDKRWQRALAELTLPWMDTLRATEHATKPPVFLVEWKSDPVSGRVQLEAEAPDLDAALAYVMILQAEPQLSQTQLLSHQQMLDPQGRMQLRVSLQTQWVRR